tara:strand:+ start:452 stop:637 length:186 start_codon:yes stop_codon:yes gene_type:complete
MSQEIEVKVDLVFDVDITEVSPGQRTEDGLKEIIGEVLDSCVYEIPGATLTKFAIEIEGLD